MRRFRWLVVAVAALVGVLALVVVVGWLLPVSHEAVRSARFSRPPAGVWAVMTDFAGGPAWRPGLDSVRRLPGGDGPRWRESGRFGTLTYEVEDVEAPRRFVTRIADPDLPYGGRWVYELRPVEGGTVVTVTEEGEVYNPIFRFVSRFVFGHARTIEVYLEALGRRLGEEVEPWDPREEA